MNANEVLANRAAEILGEPAARRRRAPERPRQHGPVDQRRLPDRDAARLALGEEGPDRIGARAVRGARHEGRVVRARPEGRPHAPSGRVPITLGQEFGGYAASVARGADDVERASEQLLELNLIDGGWHRLNAGDDYTQAAITALARESGFPWCPRATDSASRRAWATCSRSRARCAASRSRSARSPAICGCSRWARAPGSPRSAFPPYSRDRRSCRAR